MYIKTLNLSESDKQLFLSYVNLKLDTKFTLRDFNVANKKDLGYVGVVQYKYLQGNAGRIYLRGISLAQVWEYADHSTLSSTGGGVKLLTNKKLHLSRMQNSLPKLIKTYLKKQVLLPYEITL